jgi:hypothetical protein
MGVRDVSLSLNFYKGWRIRDFKDLFISHGYLLILIFFFSHLLF